MTSGGLRHGQDQVAGESGHEPEQPACERRLDDDLAHIPDDPDSPRPANQATDQQGARVDQHDRRFHRLDLAMDPASRLHQTQAVSRQPGQRQVSPPGGGKGTSTHRYPHRPGALGQPARRSVVAEQDANAPASIAEADCQPRQRPVRPVRLVGGMDQQKTSFAHSCSVAIPGCPESGRGRPASCSDPPRATAGWTARYLTPISSRLSGFPARSIARPDRRTIQSAR